MNKLALLSLVTLCACQAGTTVVVNQQTANAVAQKEQHTADMVAGFAKTTPPAGAQSMGMQSNPHAGAATLPISNVEVYVFGADIDGSAGDETLYWATDGNVVYVWGEFGLDCVDDSGDPTGETGTADFIYEASERGYGWMVATDACGWSTYVGCSAPPDGTETCGGCDFTDDAIACVAITS